MYHRALKYRLIPHLFLIKPVNQQCKELFVESKKNFEYALLKHGHGLQVLSHMLQNSNLLIFTFDASF